ncbi:hypothetical protein STCU_10694 [Strigomonas culicis]|uniref:Uncharacterized protein n=1 Tax=Strigomonas culicis TaxID=28005 RepID=S9V389_9TRYP|nr:hypothetical protein STCU_10694 [Strigomonas culicis]|eukprot:EPY17305.1 hypothetical protein STCU_10694 [Strigomonas culicis]
MTSSEKDEKLNWKNDKRLFKMVEGGFVVHCFSRQGERNRNSPHDNVMLSNYVVDVHGEVRYAFYNNNHNNPSSPISIPVRTVSYAYGVLLVLLGGSAALLCALFAVHLFIFHRNNRTAAPTTTNRHKRTSWRDRCSAWCGCCFCFCAAFCSDNKRAISRNLKDMAPPPVSPTQEVLNNQTSKTGELAPYNYSYYCGYSNETGMLGSTAVNFRSTGLSPVTNSNQQTLTTRSPVGTRDFSAIHTLHTNSTNNNQTEIVFATEENSYPSSDRDDTYNTKIKTNRSAKLCVQMFVNVLLRKHFTLCGKVFYLYQLYLYNSICLLWCAACLLFFF